MKDVGTSKRKKHACKQGLDGTVNTINDNKNNTLYLKWITIIWIDSVNTTCSYTNAQQFFTIKMTIC